MPARGHGFQRGYEPAEEFEEETIFADERRKVVNHAFATAVQPQRDAKAGEERPDSFEVARVAVHGIARTVDGFAELARDISGLWIDRSAETREDRDVQYLQNIFSSVVSRPKTKIGNMAADAVSVAVASIPAFRATRLAGAGVKAVGERVLAPGVKQALAGSKAARVGTIAAEGAAVGGLAEQVLDPYEAGLATILNEVPALEPVIPDIMAEVDPEMPVGRARLRLALEGAGLGIAGEAVLRPIAGVIKRRRAGRGEMGAQSAEALKDEVLARGEQIKAMMAAEDTLEAAGVGSVPSPLKQAKAKVQMEQNREARILRKAAEMAAAERDAMSPAMREARALRQKAGMYRRSMAEATPEQRTRLEQRAAAAEAEAAKLEGVGSPAAAVAGAQMAEPDAAPAPKPAPEVQERIVALRQEADEAELSAGRQPTEELAAVSRQDAARLRAEADALETPQEAPGAAQVAEAADTPAPAPATPEMDLTALQRAEEAFGRPIDELEGLEDEEAAYLARQFLDEDALPPQFDAPQTPQDAPGAAQAAEAPDATAPAPATPDDGLTALERLAAAVKSRPDPMDQWASAWARGKPAASATLGDALETMKQGDWQWAELRPGVRAKSDPDHGWATQRDAAWQEAMDLHGFSALAGVERHPEAFRLVWRRFEEWTQVPHSEAREAAFFKAAADHRKAQTSSVKKVLEAGVPPGVDRPLRQAVDDIKAAADLDISDWAQSRWQPGMDAPRYAAQATRSLDEVVAELPEDWSTDLAGDAALAARRSEMAPPMTVKAQYNVGGLAKGQRPLRVAFDHVEDVSDFGGLVRATGEALKDAPKAGKPPVLASDPTVPQSATESLERLIKDATPWQYEGVMGRDIAMPEIRRDVTDHSAALNAVLGAVGETRLAARRAARPDASVFERAAFVRAEAKTDALVRWLTGDDAGAARALEYGGKVTGDKLADRVVAHKLLDVEGGQQITQRASALELTDAADDVLRQIADGRKQMRRWTQRGTERVQRFARGAQEMRLASMLSSTASLGRDVGSNLVVPFAKIPGQWFETAFEGSARGGGVSVANAELRANVSGYLSGIGEFRRLFSMEFRRARAHEYAQATGKGDALKAVEAEIETSGRKKLMEEFNGRLMWDQERELLERGKSFTLGGHALERRLDGTAMAGLGRALAGAERATHTPLQLLQASTVASKNITWRMNVGRYAARQAHAEGLEGAARARRIQQILDDPPEAVRRDALAEADYNTFTNDLDAFGQGVLKIADMVPGGRIILPFIKTPWNVARFGVDLALPELRGAHRLATGQGSRRAAAEYASKRMLGLAVGFTAYSAVSNGMMTGGSLGNRQWAGTRRRMGVPDYSVKIGDTWYEYRRIGGPFGIAMGLYADLAEAMTLAQTDEEYSLASALLGATGTIFGSIADETFMGNVTEFFDMVESPSGERWERWIGNTARGYIPWSSLTDDAREYVHRLTGSGQRQQTEEGGGFRGRREDMGEWTAELAKSVRNRLKGGIFMLSDDAKNYPVLDPYGEPVRPIGTDPGSVMPLAPFASVVPQTMERTDPLSKEVLALQLPIRTMAREADEAFKVDVPYGASTSVVEMDRDERQYFQEHFGRLWKRYGTAELGTPGYRTARNPEERKGRLRAARANARHEARRMTMMKFPALRLRYEGEYRRLEAQALQVR